jgi:hypothetical protein
MKRFADKAVASAFKAYPADVRRRLMALRALVFETAAATDGVGRKWGQPSYLTEETGSGSTVRIDCLKRGRLKTGDGYAVYFHCQSGLVGQFKAIYPDAFKYEGKRALVFGTKDRLPKRALAHCIGLALTHHLRRK